ncbi:helix-turn-helix domain-containing protein [Cellulophaga tyrosinoxydans]|uniref:Helix-turn-helix domain-containing protein n=1 Tax=Cellulophaga tyrosinoxydans TaxID=504486 RepID=A0A1W1YC20_9FLAO|nr:helix-turn-helix domain-containing protein [Cellulophaga tyrosinoxydans]SMC33695.1 Helix-turn-helix domain-containing protein [Cellulophaga tyrosinoxydans]
MKQIQFIGTTPTALIDLIDETVKNRLNDLKKHLQPKEPNVYLSRNDVAEMLQIDLSSVHNWTKKGILTAYQISGRVYYKRDEVENAIVELKK